jgi:hypothetical protein
VVKLLCLDTIWKMEDGKITELFTGVYTLRSIGLKHGCRFLCAE